MPAAMQSRHIFCAAGGGQGDHGRGGVHALAGAEGAGGVKPPHARHVHIHQHHVEFGGVQRLDGFQPVFDRGDVGVDRLQHQGEGATVELVVIGDQHANGPLHARRFRRRDGFDPLAGAERQAQSEGRAFALRTRCGEIPAHKLREITTDREAEPGPAVGPGGGGAQLLEGRKQTRDLRFGHAGAGIDHLEAQTEALFSGLDAKEQGDGAFLGELDGVGKEVVEDLAQARRVAFHPAG